ncbi:amidase [Paenibacillus sp. J23TS9]|uniref:amidase n=1 Tax=Paenibacillus sp. J23TS9 TaxID=2807193 RepID=UPI001B097CF5|nr:amidase [Paenibacillus sp. J23TS9]GIP26819.1 amidase [Paenibacillus sp. J23TS9]
MYAKKNTLEMFRHISGTSDSALQHYQKQCLEHYARAEPHIHAFIHENNKEERIMNEIDDLSMKYSGHDKPPLFGIPVAIKDLIHINGLPTYAGSNLPAAALAGQEGSFVKRLREMGVWVAGKTVTEEFAYAGPIPTRNPHNCNHTAGGSSAGSAAAVAAGICPVAIGTQTLRSVTAPASFCGVAGFKPSYARIPMDGIILLAPSFDTMGLFTQDIASMEYISTHLIPGWRPFRSDRKPVLAIPNGVYMTLMFDETRNAFQDQIRKLEGEGFTIKTVDMPWSDELIYGDDLLRFVQGEMAREHETLFDQYKDCYGPAVRDAILAGQMIEEIELDGYRKGQISLRNDLMEIQQREGMDLWVSPAQGGTAPLSGGRTGWAGMTAIWTYAGLPTISIPSATVNDMPMGFQCIGSYGRDEELIYWSKQLSEVLNTRITSL